jgi:hypothetical protein
MRRHYFILLGALSGLIFLTSGVYNDNGKAGATGSPGALTCQRSGCHTGTTLNGGPGSITIVSPDLTNWEYVPGESYTIEVTVADADRSLFGFGLDALQANGDNAGTLVAGTGSQIKTAVVGGFSRRNVVHQENSGTSPQSHTWTFTWNAPDTDVGDVTFYAAGNAANGNGVSSGDRIYSTSQVVTADVSIGVEESNVSIDQLAIYPVPAQHFINMDFTLKAAGNVAIQVVSMDGKMSQAIYNAKHPAGFVHSHADISMLPAGRYIVQAWCNGVIVAQNQLVK